MVLEPAGYRVAAFHDAESARAALERERPACIVTDLMMDTLDAGFSFARSHKEDPRLGDVPIILVTAVESQRGLDFAPRTDGDLRDMHVDAFFSKPVEPRALLRKIEDLLRR
jgi:CheY-like chemotaxis protein